jgi:aryl-alcohol dehydrogenase-like predicted oxidoreductase
VIILHYSINVSDTNIQHIFDSVKGSLERLQLDYIDVLQCHRFDKDTPVEETMQALHDVVKAGYVRYIGMSSCYTWECERFIYTPVRFLCSPVFTVWKMQTYAVQNNLTPFISMQNHYNLLYREEEREMMPTLKVWHCTIAVECQDVLTSWQHFGVGSIPWSPLARGRVCRPFAVTQDQGSNRQKSDWFAGLLYRPEEYKPIVDAIEAVAKARGITMAQVALAWMLSKEQVSAPIVGTTSLENLHELVSTSPSYPPIEVVLKSTTEAVHITLTEEEIRSLEEGYKPREVAGHF